MSAREIELKRLTGNVRYRGVNQVWACMRKGWVDEYRHEHWADELAFQCFRQSLVPWTMKSSEQRDIVLQADVWFTKDVVNSMYALLLSLTTWWTPPADLERHKDLPKNERLSYITCIWEHEVQNNFDLRTVNSALQTCDELITSVQQTAADKPDLALVKDQPMSHLLKRLWELRSYLTELATYLRNAELAAHFDAAKANGWQGLGRGKIPEGGDAARSNASRGLGRGKIPEGGGRGTKSNELHALLSQLECSRF
jgi:hypothetical protein